MLILGLLCLLLGRTVAFADVINFDSVVAQAGNVTEFGRLVVDGFVLTSPHAHVITSPVTCGPACADNGTQWIGGDTTEITLARQGGGSFSLAAFDAAEAFSQGFQRPRSISLFGMFSRPGGDVETSFVFDAINDATGPLVDFQRFLLDSRWTDLRQVTFQASQGFFGLDNLVVAASPVPEPSTLLLFGTAAVTGALRAARRKRG